MQVLVIGSSGFIGKNLLATIDNTTGVSLRSHGWERQFSFADVIVNLIGKAHDHQEVANEHDYQYANVELTKQIYQEFVQSPATLLIHISSLAALEEFESLTQLRETDTCNPISWYGRSKREAEEWLLGQAIPEGKMLIILRPPMVHGPGDKGNLSMLYRLISKGIPYPLSSFDNKRSFISIDNFCYYIEKIIENPHKLKSGIYNIADDEPISTKEIIAVIKQETKKNVPNLALPKTLVKLIAKVGDVLPMPLNSKRLKKMTSDLLVSNEKIKNALGIEKLPLTAMEGLAKTIRSFDRK